MSTWVPCPRRASPPAKLNAETRPPVSYIFYIFYIFYIIYTIDRFHSDRNNPYILLNSSREDPDIKMRAAQSNHDCARAELHPLWWIIVG